MGQVTIPPSWIYIGMVGHFEGFWDFRLELSLALRCLALREPKYLRGCRALTVGLGQNDFHCPHLLHNTNK